jgi:hypothetical protein
VGLGNASEHGAVMAWIDRHRTQAD